MKSLQQLLASCFSPPSSHLTQLPWFLSGHPAAKLCLAHSLPFSLLFAPSAWTPLGPDLLPVALSHHSGLSSNATSLERLPPGTPSNLPSAPSHSLPRDSGFRSTSHSPLSEITLRVFFSCLLSVSVSRIPGGQGAFLFFTVGAQYIFVK